MQDGDIAGDIAGTDDLGVRASEDLTFDGYQGLFSYDEVRDSVAVFRDSDLEADTDQRAATTIDGEGGEDVDILVNLDGLALLGQWDANVFAASDVSDVAADVDHVADVIQNQDASVATDYSGGEDLALENHLDQDDRVDQYLTALFSLGSGTENADLEVGNSIGSTSEQSAAQTRLVEDGENMHDVTTTRQGSWGDQYATAAVQSGDSGDTAIDHQTGLDRVSTQDSETRLAATDSDDVTTASEVDQAAWFWQGGAQYFDPWDSEATEIEALMNQAEALLQLAHVAVVAEGAEDIGGGIIAAQASAADQAYDSASTILDSDETVAEVESWADIDVDQYLDLSGAPLRNALPSWLTQGRTFPI